MLDNEELAERVKIALDAAQKRLRISLAEIAGKYFDVSAQAITGWKTTGRVHRKHFDTLARISGFPVEYFLSQEPALPLPQQVREESPQYIASTQKLHIVPREIQRMISEGMLTEEQLQSLLQRAKECAEVTAVRRSTALSKSPASSRKRA